MPHENPARPAADPKQSWPWPHLPSLIPALGLLVFLGTLGVVGTQYELKPPSEFSPQTVIYKEIKQSQADSLRAAATQLRSVADGWDSTAFVPATTDSQAKVLTTRAAAYRARANALKSQANARDVVLARRHAKRLLWVYAWSIDITICLLAMFVALGVAYRTLRQQEVPSARITAAFLCVASLSLAGAMLFVWKWYDPPTPPYRLLEAALGPNVLWAARGNDGLHILTASLALWCGALMAPKIPISRPTRLAADEVDARAHELVESDRVFRLALYIATAMLVAYVAAVSTQFQWLLSFIDPDAQVYGAVEALCNSAITARALLSTGILIVAAGGAAAVTRLTAYNLAQRALPLGSVADRAKWTDERGLGATGMQQHLKTLAAVFAPLATGIVAQVLQGFA